MNRYNPNIHHRRSIRLKGYDYSQAGLYFVTIVTKNREHLFGKIKNGKMILNDAGKMFKNEWLILPERFTKIRLHEYTVMPNHFHAILEIVSPTTNVSNQNKNTVVGSPLVGDPNNKMVAKKDKGQPRGIALTVNPTLGNILGAFQSIVTVKYIRGVKEHNWKPFDGKLFQRNYWEHIIRNEKSYITISEYIINNPEKWNDDKFYK